ncbi:MAG: Rrf2 family transcriptional regulator [Opitutaceae bacterium]|nr:Rrf2 family transcriptional regulator [Opitutaceae bacterium]
MACLARAAGADAGCLTACEVARQQRLPRAFVAKILGRLAHAGLVRGTRGLHGGYRLSRSPQDISLAEIAAVFESAKPHVRCPLGAVGNEAMAPCPLHASLHGVTSRWIRFLRDTTLAVPAAARPLTCVRRAVMERA